MTRTTWQRWAAGFSALGLTMLGLSALAPIAPAGADAPGTVKIVVNGGEVVKAHGNVDNDPHVDCGFHIVFNGFTSLENQPVTANIQIQSPSAPVDQSIFLATAKIGPTGYLDIPVDAGKLTFTNSTVANHTENGNNDSEKIDTADPTELTYHVTLDTSTTIGGDQIAKQKTFWLGDCQASPKIATTVSSQGTGTIGATFTDSATLTDFASSAPLAGTVTFKAYDNALCKGDPVFTSTGPISHTGTATSNGFTPAAVGTYYFIASYSGDANNNPVAGACGETPEILTVGKAPSSVVTTVAPGPNSTAKDPAYIDTATVTGHNPTGTVVFKAWSNNTCTGPAIFTSTERAVNDNGTATSGVFAPTAPATATTYSFIAYYGGDANNAAAHGACGDSGESITFTPGAAQSAISTQFAVGNTPNTFTDTATVTGKNPTGTVTFRVYGPAADCAGPFVTLAPSTLSGGSATSAPFTASAAGTYTFVASYGGDANNTPVTGACSDANEQFTVHKASPTISTTNNASTATPGAYTDTATLSNVAAGHTPSGTMTFRVFGPNNSDCADQGVALAPSTVNGLSTTSRAFSPPGPGTYTFIASYSGDEFNSPVTGHCSDEDETFTVSKATPDISTNVVQDEDHPGRYIDTAQLTELAAGRTPTGTVTFAAYNTSDCSGTPVFTSADNPVGSNGTATSKDSFRPMAAGTYKFIASYSGDANNAAVSGHCGDAGETVVLPALLPSVTVVKTNNAGGNEFADTNTATGPNQSVEFHAVITNDSSEPETITSITDTYPGSGGPVPECTTGDGALVGTTLAPGHSVTCDFTISGYSPAGGSSITNTVNVLVTDTGDHTATSSDTSIVTTPATVIPPVIIPPGTPVVLPSTSPTPTVTVVKTNDAGGNDFAKTNEAKKPGDSVDFRAVITNSSSEPETITAIADQFGGFTPSECPELINTVLPPQTSVTCNFTIPGYAPAAGESLTNTLTVNVRDTANLVASATDTSTVTSRAVEATGGAKAPSVTPPPAVVTPTPPAVAVLPASGVRTLPFTGTNVWTTFLTGFGLLLMGLALWIKSYRVPGAKHYA